MFKFAKYFFVIFLITTVIPLTLMLVWNHNQMERMRIEREQHLLYVGSKQLEHTTKLYLKIRESYILEKIQDLSLKKMSLKQVQKVFNADKVEFIYKTPVNNISSYYDLAYLNNSAKLNLCSVTILPFNKSGIAGIKILEKVNFDQLRPPGPFDIKIYAGNKINNNTYLGSALDLFVPIGPDMDHHMHPPDNPPLFNRNGPGMLQPPDENIQHMIPQEMPHHPMLQENHEFAGERSIDNRSSDKDTQIKKVSITNNTGKTVATLTIKFAGFSHHFSGPSPENPVENEFGLLVLIAGSICSLLIGYHINKNFINPLLILSNAIKQVQEGNLAVELVTNIKHKQIINTFNNFNRMVKGLKEKDELRKSFITNLTHDLRTPLIAQERALQLISEEFEALEMKDAFKLAKGTEKNTQHLLRMVNLILESYSFDSENLKLIFTNVNMSEIINNCYENLSPLASEKNIRLENNIPEDFPLFYGDKTSINRIFINLVSNSIDSITENGKIKIDAVIEDNFVKVIVEDDGPGIAPEDIGFIFDRHYTGKSADRKLGSGFGLYVCKKLVELHKGEIIVESELNRYTRFIIKLPENVEK